MRRVGPAIWATAAIKDGRKLKAGEAGLLAAVSTHPRRAWAWNPSCCSITIISAATLVATIITNSIVNIAVTSIHRQQQRTYHSPASV